MTKIKVLRRGKCLSCGKEDDILNVLIGRNEQSMVGVEICHNCLVEIVVKANLKIFEKEERKKK